jgi:hypothetical protein
MDRGWLFQNVVDMVTSWRWIYQRNRLLNWALYDIRPKLALVTLINIHEHVSNIHVFFTLTRRIHTPKVRLDTSPDYTLLSGGTGLAWPPHIKFEFKPLPHVIVKQKGQMCIYDARSVMTARVRYKRCGRNHPIPPNVPNAVITE